MARTKLSDEEKAKKKAEEMKQQLLSNLASERKELTDRFAWGFIKTPTRQFEIGERVSNGAHEHTVILEKELDGVIYLIQNKYKKEADAKKYQREEDIDNTRWVAWTDVYKYRSLEDIKKIPVFEPKDDVRFNYYQTALSSFFSKVYYFGVDMNPDYQRELVWDIGDKVRLVDSIFKNIDIGKFAFIKRDYDRSKNPSPHMYEILDGKQRLTAIMEFLEDRFKWNGYLFSELTPRDQWHFTEYKISMAETGNMTKKQIYRYFLKLNTGGKPMAKEHIAKIEGLLNKAEEND